MKTLLLAISGSIAFYKTYELISLFKKEGFKVKVLLSNGASRFASKISFEALCDDVLCEENETWKNANNHIAFSKDCDLILFAPASINSINKLALGICDNLFIQTLIAAKLPLIIAPAANTNMYLHFSVQNSLKLLKEQGALIIDPICKKLACNDEGIGALAEVLDIFNIVKRELLKEKFFIGKSVVVTGGGTKEKIDEVRCISNFSSGLMAKAIADAFYFLGANVTFLSSVDFKTPYKLLKFESSKELKELLIENKNKDFLIMSAAVSDFIPIMQAGKIKKNEHLEGLELKLLPNEDLLKNIDFKGKKIGFKLEFDEKNAIKNAKHSLKDKKLDMICLNILKKENSFGSNLNEILCISAKDEVLFSMQDKKNLAYKLAYKCKEL